jgi:hypothetical protein
MGVRAHRSLRDRTTRREGHDEMAIIKGHRSEIGFDDAFPQGL